MSPALAPEAVRSAACALEAAPAVVGASVLPPEQSPRDAWTIEATIVADGGAPPQLLATLADHGLTVPEIAPRGSAYRLLAVH
jgi:hypothetical protein